MISAPTVIEPAVDDTLHPSVDTIASQPVAAESQEEEVIREWGGERVWSVWLCYTTFLILLMLAPLSGVQHLEILSIVKLTWFDKLVHLGLFSTLTGMSGCVFFPFCRDPYTTITKITPGRLGLLLTVVWTLGVGLECAQPLFGRSFDWFDMAANVFAVVPGFGVFLILNEIRHYVVNLDL